eukprot:6209595-Pleurochrysis_carterae.AAC.3
MQLESGNDMGMKFETSASTRISRFVDVFAETREGCRCSSTECLRWAPRRPGCSYSELTSAGRRYLF